MRFELLTTLENQILVLIVVTECSSVKLNSASGETLGT